MTAKDDGEQWIPVKDPPTLIRFNGMGTRIFILPMRTNGTRVGVVMFCFLFIPVFPVSRYLVGDADDGDYFFIGRIINDKKLWMSQLLVMTAICGGLYLCWLRGLIPPLVQWKRVPPP